MYLDLIIILINSGLFVFIWTVQLVIYPGFSYYSEVDLKKWHPIYKRNTTLIVFPLMVGQLGLYAYKLWSDATYVTLCLMVLVVATWLVTFLMAVPLHEKISTKENTVSDRIKLVRVNWLRTVVWSIILIISLLEYDQ